MTQIPLPETVADTWRLVYDYNLYTIVMINTLDYKDPVSIFKMLEHVNIKNTVKKSLDDIIY